MGLTGCCHTVSIPEIRLGMTYLSARVKTSRRTSLPQAVLLPPIVWAGESASSSPSTSIKMIGAGGSGGLLRAMVGRLSSCGTAGAGSSGGTSDAVPVAGVVVGARCGEVVNGTAGGVMRVVGRERRGSISVERACSVLTARLDRALTSGGDRRVSRWFRRVGIL